MDLPQTIQQMYELFQIVQTRFSGVHGALTNYYRAMGEDFWRGHISMYFHRSPYI